MSKRLDLLSGKWITEEYKGKRKSPEAAIGKQVDSYLKSIGAYFRTIKSDGTKTANGWRRSAQGRGISDRVGVLPGGKALAVELKAPGKKNTLTDEQFEYLWQVSLRGGCACVADSVECVKRAISSDMGSIQNELLKYKPADKNYQRAMNFNDTPFD